MGRCNRCNPHVLASIQQTCSTKPRQARFRRFSFLVGFQFSSYPKRWQSIGFQSKNSSSRLSSADMCVRLNASAPSERIEKLWTLLILVHILKQMASNLYSSFLLLVMASNLASLPDFLPRPAPQPYAPRTCEAQGPIDKPCGHAASWPELRGFYDLIRCRSIKPCYRHWHCCPCWSSTSKMPTDEANKRSRLKHLINQVPQLWQIMFGKNATRSKDATRGSWPY